MAISVINDSIPASVAFSTIGNHCVFQKGSQFFIKIDAGHSLCLDPNGSGLTDEDSATLVIATSSAVLHVAY